MAASPHAQPISRREDALAIVQRLVDAGHVAYFAGGCVRDSLLGLTPKDYDVATSAPPDEVCRLFPKSQGVGQAFGVVLVRLGKSMIEVATFRADGTYTDGRRPDEVHFAGPEEDARRRDFTINGLFFDPLADRVIDLVGGVADLEKRILRAIGDPAKRFAEDYLRLLRAIRFASRFDLVIDPPTETAIRVNIERLPQIAPERIAGELRAMLAAPSRGRSVELLATLRLTQILLRRVILSIPSVAALTLLSRVTADDRPPSFALCLAAWTVDAARATGQSVETTLQEKSAKALTHSLRHTFRLSNDQSDAIEAIFSGFRLTEGASVTIARLKRFAADRSADDAMRLLRALAGLGIRSARVEEIDTTLGSFAGTDIAPPPLISGDYLATAGYAPGPRFKSALDAAYDAQLEGRASTRDEALAVARLILDVP